MIKNIENRIDFWNERHKIKYQGNTYYNENLIKKYSYNSTVLEIGPGEGRQFQIAYPCCKEYSIADISPNVLLSELYNKEKVKNKYLIDRYEKFLDKYFEFIHFWYVLHHIKLEEDIDFFRFIRNCMNKYSILVFNFSENTKAKFVHNDGVKTTNRKIGYIKSILEMNNLNIMDLHKMDRNNIIVECKVNA